MLNNPNFLVYVLNEYVVDIPCCPTLVCIEVIIGPSTKYGGVFKSNTLYIAVTVFSVLGEKDIVAPGIYDKSTTEATESLTSL